MYLYKQHEAEVEVEERVMMDGREVEAKHKKGRDALTLSKKEGKNI